MSENKGKFRRGLVLEGGGAKGAWQFGAVRALVENGIVFDAASGTSVGALNGALYSSGQMNFGHQLWNGISRKRIFSINFFWIPILFLNGLSRTFLSYVMGYAGAVSNPLPRLVRIFFTILCIFPYVGAYIVTMYSFDWLIDEGNFTIAITLLFYGFIYIVLMLNNRRPFYHLGVGGVFFCERLFEYTIDSGFSTYAPVFYILTLPYVLILFAYIFRFFNISGFRATPLGAYIEKIIECGFKIPLYVTYSTESRAYIDPDNVDYRGRAAGRYWVPGPLRSIVAHYQRIDFESHHMAREYLLASSALPLGLLAYRMLNDGENAIDGGVSDNVPWYPFIEMFPCDEVVIIRCNPSTAQEGTDRLQEWKCRERIFRVIEENITLPNMPNYSSIHNTPPIVMVEREPESWPKAFLEVAPEASLGTFISGTLRFSGRQSKIWQEAGYQAGLKLATQIRLNSHRRALTHP